MKSNTTPNHTNTETQFSEFLTEVDPVIRGVIRHNPVSGIDPEDLAQESRLRLFLAWQRLDNGRQISQPEGLAAVITRRVCIAAIKRAQLQRQAMTFSSEAVDIIMENLRAAEPRWDAFEDREMLAGSLTLLSETNQRLILRRYYRHQTFNQIGQALGIHTSTAKRRIQRAIELLADLMD